MWPRSNGKVMEACRVVIEVTDPEPDALKRIALLNSAFMRVVTGARLIEVERADYESGRIEVVIEDGRTHPPVEGRVSVRYAQL